ncbi:AN1-type zinc finger protein 2B [Lampetra fluviatilis]
MELPDLGKHCMEAACKRLDFLPMRCDACELIFCKDHFSYSHHRCASAYRKDVQVPVCPLCNKPVPVGRGETPDVRVGQHMDQECQSTRTTKIYTNRCSQKGCKQKELVKVVCDSCQNNFCLKHRHPADHECIARPGGLSRAGTAAVIRAGSSQRKSASSKATPAPGRTHTSQPTTQAGQPPLHASQPAVHAGIPNRGPARDRATLPAATAQASLQAGLTEEEALQLALQMSLAENTPAPPHSEDDELARALQASRQQQELEQQQRQQAAGRSSRDNNCSLC